MKATTLPKHKTPNYRQVRHTRRNWVAWKNGWETFVWWIWEPMPLRSTRKDLAA